MWWLPFRHACRNVIFQSGVEEFLGNSVRWSHGINYLLILSVTIFITWPQEEFLNLRDLPLTYNAVGAAAFIMLGYINFSQGARCFLGKERMSVRSRLSLAPIRPDTFIRGYLAAHILETLFYWVLSLPLLVLAAGVAGESLTHVSTGALVLLICTVSYRTVAVALLVCLECHEFPLYILVRAIYVFFMIVSGFVLPMCNPVRAFADASLWHERHHLPSLTTLGEMTIPGWMVTLGLHLLIAGLFFIIATVRVRWVRRQAIRLGAVAEES